MKTTTITIAVLLSAALAPLPAAAQSYPQPGVEWRQAQGDGKVKMRTGFEVPGCPGLTTPRPSRRDDGTCVDAYNDPTSPLFWHERDKGLAGQPTR